MTGPNEQPPTLIVGKKYRFKIRAAADRDEILIYHGELLAIDQTFFRFLDRYKGELTRRLENLVDADPWEESP